MFELMVIAEVTNARQHDILKEAECDRLMQTGEATKFRFRERLLVGVGDALISAGKKLRGRYVPVMPQGSGAYQS